MHFSVVCAEDVPRLAMASGQAGRRLRHRLRGALREAVRGLAARRRAGGVLQRCRRAPSPVLLLSGGIDPATPPRHGERVARALGPLARHVVVANAGHGVMAIGCMRDVVFRFIDAATDAEALAVDAGCAADVPRPPAFEPIGAGADGGVGGRRDDRGRAASPSPSLSRSAGQARLARRCARPSASRAARRPCGARRQLQRARTATSPACSARTAPARRRPCACSPALITPDAGTLAVDGIDVVERPREVLARMGVLSDARGLYPRLTARENIVYYGAPARHGARGRRCARRRTWRGCSR